MRQIRTGDNQPYIIASQAIPGPLLTAAGRVICGAVIGDTNMADQKTAEAIAAFKNGGKGGDKAMTLEEIDAQIAELQRKRAELEEAERKAAMADDAKRAIALLAAMREAYRQIQETFPDTFSDEKFAALAVTQAWPRDVKIRRAADLSETEADNARQAGKAAIEKLKM